MEGASATLPWKHAIAYFTWAICFLGITTAASQHRGQAQIPVHLHKYQQGNQHGAVASENKLCTQIGIDLLNYGGNAVDALVGTTFCVGVIGMYHSGIGGGGYAIVRSSNGSYEVVDFRESAPASAHEAMFENNHQGAIIGGLAAAVPGDSRGLEYLHKNYGLLSWKDVVLPAVRIARDGFPLTEDSVFFFNLVTQDYDFLKHDPAWAIDFAPDGTRLGLGDIMTRKRYANTLEAIALHGADAFYTGAIANSTIRALQANNGTMTMEDLENYEVVSRKPIETIYRGYRVLGCGAPASGAVTMSVLKTVEGYLDFGVPDMLNLSMHRFVEAMRFGYAQRASLGDPDFVEGMDRYQQGMFDDTKSAATRAKISDFHTLNVSAYNPSGFEIIEDHGTSHVVSADHGGMAVSLTTTINLIFGNRIIVPETGVILNDEMEDFSIPKKRNQFGYVPSPANYIRPRKRPMSSVTPTIVEHALNHSLYYVIGSAGGSHIITATLQALWHVLDHNMTALQALAEPRAHDQLVPNIASFEWGFNNATVAFMRDRLHSISWAPPFTSAQGIRRLWDGSFEAAGEPRQKASAGCTT